MLHPYGDRDTDGRQGLGPAEIGAFVGSLYLPWAFKWIGGHRVFSEMAGLRDGTVGYPVTLLIDSTLWLACIGFPPLVGKLRTPSSGTQHAGGFGAVPETAEP